RRVEQVQAQAAIELVHLDVEVGVELARGTRVVAGAAGGQHRQGAAAQQLVHAAGGSVAQARDFLARQHVQAASRENPGVDGGKLGGSGHCLGRFVHGASIWGGGDVVEKGTAGSPRPSPYSACGVDQNSYLKPICAD